MGLKESLLLPCSHVRDAPLVKSPLAPVMGFYRTWLLPTPQIRLGRNVGNEVKSPNFPPKVTIVYIWLQLVGATVIVGQSIPFFKVEHTLW